MLRIMLVVVAALALVSATPKEECKKLMRPHLMMCCKSRPEMDTSDHDMMKECFEKTGKPTGPPNCDLDLCLAKKKGIASDDGVIDKKALEADVEKTLENNPELVELIQKDCINGDVSNYGPEDMCELMKMRHCMHVQRILTCPDLDNSGPCSGVKELAEECKKPA